MTISDPTFLTLQSSLAGEYSLEKELGRGGMGIVYLAREVQLDRLVAIKALPAEMGQRAEIRERFLRESKTAAALSHPNIVAIHRVGEADGIPYFVMSFVRGETLGERLRARGPVSPTLLTRILHDVSLALGYAHARGVVHRDVKPDNILIEEGSERAMVTDFGIAQIGAEREASEAAMGTKHFVSPEQAMGAPIDGRSDIYSLGVVAFLAASGRFPVNEEKPDEPVPSIGAVAAGMPRTLAAVIDRCLAREVTKRFTAAEQVAAALDSAMAPTKSAIPVALRMWASTPTPLLPAYQLVSLTFAILAANEAREIAFHTGSGSNLLPFLGIAAAPFVPVMIFQAKKTERTLGAGYTIGDLRLALRSWIAERKEEIRFELAQGESVGARVARSALLATALIFVGSLVWYAAYAYPHQMELVKQMYADGNWAMRPNRRGELVRYLNPPTALIIRVQAAAAYNQIIEVITAISGLVTVGLAIGMTAFGVQIEPAASRLKSVGSWRTRFWNSRVGAWWAKHLTPKKRGVADSAFRPTELALGTAVHELFAALPTSYRQHVGDLPAVGERLMTEAAHLRSEVDRLETIRMQAPPDEMKVIDPSLADVRTRLGQTVGALERMRLELLRLHGGTTDLRPLTTSLDLARDMVDSLVRLRESEDEVEPKKRLFAFDSRSPSPLSPV